MQDTIEPPLFLDRALAIQGYMSKIELAWLALRARDCRVIVEFGSYLGRSTRAMADNIGKDGRIYAVDPWDGKYFTDDGVPLDIFSEHDYEQFQLNMHDHLNLGTVIPFTGHSQRFPPFVNFADMVFIDADHRYEYVLEDIFSARSIIKSGGIIAGHDYGRVDWPGVKKAVDEVFKNEPIHIVDTIWWVTYDK